MIELSERDQTLLRAAIALSGRAGDAGNMPYGALLADLDGRVLLEAQNTQVTSGDCTGHAELNLVRVASSLFGPQALRGRAVYASGEPCPMCAGALYWAGVERVVFALSIETMTALAGPGADELATNCAGILSTGTRPVEVLGPALENEARLVFDRPPP